MSPGPLRRLLRTAAETTYRACIAALHPVNVVLARLHRDRFEPGSVLHVSYPVHTAWGAVEALRAEGVDASYLAIGRSPVWSRCDHTFEPSRWPPLCALQEVRLVWGLVARYEVLHLHFMIPATRTGWELPLLTGMGRKVVVHWRGCEVRDPARLQTARPEVNICQECDYSPRICELPVNRVRRELARRHAHAALVTTPDLLQFAPGATHLPFFLPALPQARAGARTPRTPGAPLRLVHATNHPGIEGTRHIRAAVERLRAQGQAIELECLHGQTPERVLEALATADASIGKMKMGYYANLQVESLILGVPAITWVWPELRTPELEASGLIITSLDELPATLLRLLRHPEELEAKRAVARESALELHGPRRTTHALVEFYTRLVGTPP